MSLDQIAIRAAEPSDATEIADLRDAAWRGAYRGIIPGLTLERMIEKRGPAYWQKQIQRERSIRILECHGQVAGYTTFGINRTRSLRVQGEMYELYLRPTHQGLGFGRKLFDEARACLEQAGLGHFVVWALEDNEPAVEFYRSMGGEAVAHGMEQFDGQQCRKVAFAWGGVSPFRGMPHDRSASH